MPEQQIQFGGLNTDISPNRLRSGTSDTATNVEIQDGELSKRRGFGFLKTLSLSISNMFTVGFNNGDRYNIVKAGSKLYHNLIGTTTWTEIVTTHTLSSERGWFYFWGDRLHYMDSGGANRWHPDVNLGVAYKDGLPKPISTLASAAAGGAKEGVYHCHHTHFNRVTQEESVASSVQSASTPSYISQGTGGILYGPTVLVTDYEFDSFRFYCTIGFSDLYGTISGKAYLEREVDKAAASFGLIKPNSFLATAPRMNPIGGEPPGSMLGCYAGNRAIYLRPFEDAAEVEGQIFFSLPGKPTMVPEEVIYSAGSQITQVEPRPYRGRITSDIDSQPVACCYGGGIASIFTNASTYQVQLDERGRIKPVKIHHGIGAQNDGACVGTTSAVHHIQNSTWGVIGRGGWQDLSRREFEGEVAALSAKGTVTMAYYSHREQVWAAAGDTVLVYDPNSGNGGALVKWTLAGATITAMCEVAGDGTPTMRLGCSDGAIYEWPTANAYDVHESSSADFASSWVGYVSQESFTRPTRLETFQVFTRTGCSGNMSIGTRAVQSPDNLPTQQVIPASDISDNQITPIKTATGNTNALFWQIEFSSAALSTGSAKRWIVTSLVSITE
jgi:hypothetical protein